MTRRTLPAGTELSAADVAASRLCDDADAVQGSCAYEADALDDEYMRSIGFYPADNPTPPF